MRILLFLFTILYALSASGQVRNPFLLLKFDKVVLYDYEPTGEDPSLISKGQLIKAVKIKKQVQLDVATGRSISAKLGDAKSYGQVKAMCFEPHLGIVY